MMSPDVTVSGCMGALQRHLATFVFGCPKRPRLINEPESDDRSAKVVGRSDAALAVQEVHHGHVKVAPTKTFHDRLQD